MMEARQIIMNYTRPPSIDEVEVIASEAVANLPEEIREFCEALVVQVEDMPDETIEIDMELDDPYELILLYRSGKQLSPGVEKKVANDDDVLVVFRRPLLDFWCEAQDDINIIMRQLIIEELGHQFEFAEDDIEEMVQSHHQGVL